MPIDTHNPAEIVPAPSYNSEDDGIYALVELLWEKRKRVLFYILAGVALAVVLRLSLPARYESTARMLPSDPSSDATMMMVSGAAGSGGGNFGVFSDLLGMKTPGALCAAILRSDTVLDAVIGRLGLRAEYKSKDPDSARKKLLDSTVVIDDKKSGIVSLTAADSDPKRAADIANAYTDELDRVLQTLNTSAAHREREFLEKRIDVVRQSLGSAEQQLGQFSSKNSALDIKEQGKAAFEVASKIQGELIAAQSELQGLRQIYGPDHPRVKQAEARVSQLRSATAKLGSSADEEGPDMQFLSLSRLPIVGVTYADLYREVKVQEAIYEALLKRYEISKVEEAKQTPRLSVIDPGRAPAQRSSPRLLVLLVFCTLSFATFGVLTVFFEAKWNNADPDNPWKRLGMRVGRDLRGAVERAGYRVDAHN